MYFRRWITLLTIATALSVALGAVNSASRLDPSQIPSDDSAVYVGTVKTEFKPKHVARTPKAARGYARTQLGQYGWGDRQWSCVSKIWQRESNWRPNAYNKVKVGGRNAGGIPQILGLDPATPVERQIHRGFKYIESRYTTPCKAWQFWQFNGWY